MDVRPFRALGHPSLAKRKDLETIYLKILVDFPGTNRVALRTVGGRGVTVEEKNGRLQRLYIQLFFRGATDYKRTATSDSIRNIWE